MVMRNLIRISVVQRVFFELLDGDTVHRVKRKLVWTTRCRQPSSPRVVGQFV